MRRTLAIAFPIALALACYALPVLASVEGTLDSGTDMFIAWVRAGAALLIIYSIFMAIRTGSILGSIGVVVGLAAIIGAREIATIIS